MSIRTFWIVVVLIAQWFGQAIAEAPPSMTLTDGKLAGEGAGILLAELPDAQFILVGEDHGFADSPEIALALAREARKFGVTHHALEIGPGSDTLVTKVLRRGDEAGLAELLAGRPLAMPFVNMAEDARLADYFVDSAGDVADPLWGTDQEFIGSTLIFLEKLAAMAPAKEAAMLAQQWLDAEKKAFSEGNMGTLFLMSAKPEDFQQLSLAFSGNTEALVLLSKLAESAEIYQFYATGANYASNAARIDLMRRQFLAAYRAAPESAPRALFKYGASHLGRGTGPLNTFDLGSLTEGIAAANGLDVLRIAFIPLEGAQTLTNPASPGVFETATYRSEDVAALLAAAGIEEASIPVEGYAVIPLENVRLKLEQKGLSALSADNRFLVLGYDYLVTTRGARPATPLTH